MQNKASQHPVRPTRPDGRDAHFVVADVNSEGEAIWELLARANRVLKEVALERGLPLEESKEEKLIL